jgi:hypothetical protein
LTAKRKTAGELSGPCPWCGGKDRFTLFTEQGTEGLGRYWCRQCGKGGDAIQFLRELDGLSFQEAKAALDLSELPRRPRRKEAPAPARSAFIPEPVVPPGEVWQLRAARIIFWATAQLRDNPEVQDWLRKERGLTLNAALASGLGWIPQDYYRPREVFGLTPEYREDGKLKRVWIPQGLSIPVLTREGAILRVKFRVAPKEGQNRPKYIPLPQVEKCTAPLVLQSHSGASSWQVVESELDAVLLAQEAGHLVNVVGMGSASYRPDAETWAKLQTAPRVLVSLDFDEAGNKAACRWWETHLKPGAFKLWPVPEGKDPCDSWRLGWNLAEWVEEAL